MFKRGWGKINFVCLDDITNTTVEMNTVIYNPKFDKDIDIRKKKLFNYIHKNFKIDLTEEELDRLCLYESDDLYKFIDDIRNIISTK